MKYKLLLILLLFCFSASAQRTTLLEAGWWPVLDGGYLRQGNQHRIDVNYGVHRVKRWLAAKDSSTQKTATLSRGPSAGLIGFVDKQNIFRVGQQLGFSLVYNNVKKIPFGFKTGVYLENYTRKDQRISFTGGPLLLGIIHCQYGYSIPFGKETIPGIGRHRLGIIIYINTIGISEFLDRVPMM